MPTRKIQARQIKTVAELFDDMAGNLRAAGIDENVIIQAMNRSAATRITKQKPANLELE